MRREGERLLRDEAVVTLTDSLVLTGANITTIEGDAPAPVQTVPFPEQHPATLLVNEVTSVTVCVLLPQQPQHIL